MASDRENFLVKYTKANATASEILAQLESDLVAAQALGNEVLVAKLEARKLKVQGGGREAPAIEEASSALARENALKRQGLALDLEALDVLKAQAKQRAEQVALTEELKRSSLIVPTAPRITGYGTMSGRTAGQTIAMEEQAALAQRLVQEAKAADLAQFQLNSKLALERVARQKNLELQAAQAKQAREQVAAQEALLAQHAANARQAGFTAGAAGGRVPAEARATLMGAPVGAESWTAAQAATQRYNIALGEYEGFATRGSLASRALTANLTRLGIAENEASNSMRVHGALTTEYLSALMRGETTISELGYQVSATIGKFAGWTIAASAVYTALGAVYEFGKGALDTASSVQQLTRTIEDLDKQKASTALQNLSREVNVPIKEAGDAVFLFSRTFHNIDDAVTAAGLALATFKLDGVAVADSVKAQTAIHQQFGISAKGLVPIYDELAQGQQKFNARVTEQIPALLKSSAAVKIAGGDLRALIELTTIALRTTSLSGSQVGTAFSRSAANFLNPTTTKGQADRSVLRSLGLDTSLGYTDLIFQAISKAPGMTPNQISQMTQAIFGPLRGGLMAGLFTGGPGLVGPVGRELSPAGSKGVLQTELAKELATISQQLHAFVNGLQQVGAALAQTGTLTPFGLALHLLVGAIDGVRQVIDLFDQLPHAAKQVVTGLVEARLAMLLLSRTSIGGSIAKGTGLAALGLGPSQETLQRQTLARGTFTSMKAVESSYAQTRAQLLTIGERQAVEEAKRGAIEAKIAASGVGTLAQYEASNAISAKISDLQHQQAVLTEEAIAQKRVQATLEAQYLGVSKSQRRGGYSSAQVAELNAETAVGTDALAAEAAANRGAAEKMGVVAFTSQKVRASVAKLTGAAVAQTAATEELTVATTAEALALQEALAGNAALSVAMVDATAAALEAAAAAGVGAAEEGTFGAALAVTGGSIKGMGAGLLGMAGAMDPLLLALIGLPIAFELLKSVGDHVDKAVADAEKTIKAPVTSLKQLEARARALQTLQRNRQSVSSPTQKAASGFFSFVTTPERALWGALFGDDGHSQAAIQGAPPTIYARGQSPWEQTLKALTAPGKRITSGPQPTQAAIETGWSQELNRLNAQAKADGASMKNTHEGRVKYYAQLAALKRQGEEYLAANPTNAKDAVQSMSAFATALQNDYNAQQARMAAKTTPDLFSEFETMSSANIRKRVTGLGDVFTAGIGGDAQLKEASAAVAYLGNKINKGSSSADLQAFGAAMQSFQSDLHKLTGDFVHAAASAPTAAAQAGDLAKARQAADAEIKNIHAELELSIQKYKGNKSAIAKAIALANYRLGIVADELQTIQQADDARIQTASTLAQAEIKGSNPAADIARAEVALKYLKQEYAKAKADGASWTILSGLLAQVDTATNALAKQKIDNADAIAQARGALATASIMGIGPAADLARARQDVANAQAQLDRDRTNKAGQAKIYQDQAALDNAIRTVNQQIQSNAQAVHQDLAAYIQSQSDLAQSQTTDPVRQAQEQLAADIRTLPTIKRGDYKTDQAYQTARNEQLAKINKDRQSVTGALLSQQESTLKFELDTQRISDQQYVDGLRRLLKLKNLSLSQRQQLQSEIYNINKSSAVDLNVGNIKLPTTYEVRKAIAAAHHGKQSIGTAVSATVTQTNHFDIHVTKDTDLRKVTDAIAEALGTNTQGTAQAMGMI